MSESHVIKYVAVGAPAADLLKWKAAVGEIPCSSDVLSICFSSYLGMPVGVMEKLPSQWAKITSHVLDADIVVLVVLLDASINTRLAIQLAEYLSLRGAILFSFVGCHRDHGPDQEVVNGLAEYSKAISVDQGHWCSSPSPYASDRWAYKIPNNEDLYWNWSEKTQFLDHLAVAIKNRGDTYSLFCDAGKCVSVFGIGESFAEALNDAFQRIHWASIGRNVYIYKVGHVVLQVDGIGSHGKQYCSSVVNAALASQGIEVGEGISVEILAKMNGDPLAVPANKLAAKGSDGGSCCINLLLTNIEEVSIKHTGAIHA